MTVHHKNFGLDETATLFAVAQVFNYRKEQTISFIKVFNNVADAKALAYSLCKDSLRGMDVHDDDDFDCWLDGGGVVYYTGNGYDRYVYWVYALPQ